MDILSVKVGIIGHQVNMQGIMGAGLAKQIADIYPVVYEKYIEDYQNRKLGDVLTVAINQRLVIANIFGQENIGTDEVQTDYGALADGFLLLNQYAQVTNLPVYLPEGIGCGLAGGNWETVKPLIQNYIPFAWIVSLQRGAPYRI